MSCLAIARLRFCLERYEQAHSSFDLYFHWQLIGFGPHIIRCLLSNSIPIFHSEFDMSFLIQCASYNYCRFCRQDMWNRQFSPMATLLRRRDLPIKSYVCWQNASRSDLHCSDLVLDCVIWRTGHPKCPNCPKEVSHMSLHRMSLWVDLYDWLHMLSNNKYSASMRYHFKEYHGIAKAVLLKR